MRTFQPVTQKIVSVNHLATAKKARKFRVSIGLSLRGAAAIMGISHCYLSELERGRRNWTPVIIKKFKLLKKA